MAVSTTAWILGAAAVAGAGAAVWWWRRPTPPTSGESPDPSPSGDPTNDPMENTTGSAPPTTASPVGASDLGLGRTGSTTTSPPIYIPSSFPTVLQLDLEPEAQQQAGPIGATIMGGTPIFQQPSTSVYGINTTTTTGGLPTSPARTTRYGF